MTVMDYRTRDGLAEYGFSIDFEPARGWRVYIIFQPFRQEDDSLSLPYQAIDSNGRRYVDWPEKLDSLGDAKTVAGLWAEEAQRYHRTQKQRSLHVELIERHRRTQEQRRTTPAGPDRLADAVGAGETGPGHQDHGLAIPRPQAPAELSTDPQESERTTQAVANATSAMAARAGDTTPNISNNATRNTDSADASGRNRKPGIRLRIAANALFHRRPTRGAPHPGEVRTDSRLLKQQADAAAERQPINSPSPPEPDEQSHRQRRTT